MYWSTLVTLTHCFRVTLYVEDDHIWMLAWVVGGPWTMVFGGLYWVLLPVLMSNKNRVVFIGHQDSSTDKIWTAIAVLSSLCSSKGKQGWTSSLGWREQSWLWSGDGSTRRDESGFSETKLVKLCPQLCELTERVVVWLPWRVVLSGGEWLVHWLLD